MSQWHRKLNIFYFILDLSLVLNVKINGLLINAIYRLDNILIVFPKWLLNNFFKE